ncbi:MAG: ATP synthase F1 subunit gamma [Lachnospiraceae bacterium]|nr:ATP synthase F1 subunit gamma [Lachnospiraceae bacterium]
MASMRSIKRRRDSITSTQQITKAMKLVSTVKLQRAKANAERSKAYFQCMYQTVTSLLSKTGEIRSPYLVEGKSEKKAIIVITGNRGLAGGYNSNVIKLVTRDEKFTKENVLIYAIGTKGADYFRSHGYQVAAEYSEVIEQPVYSDAMYICNELLKAFKEEEFGEIYLAYTAFKNTVSHIPTLLKLLPVNPDGVDTSDMSGQEAASDAKALMNFEQDEEEALEMLVPKYVSSLVYGAMVEAVASENGARMQAMDSATSNAEEMIEKLSLQYNRARQGSITQELTEIIAGADAIG